MRTFCFACLFLLAIPAFSQPLIIEDTTRMERGIYRTFEEFRYNKPSIRVDFSVVNKTRGYGFLNATLHNAYKLVLTNPQSLHKKDTVWGFCDGKSVYVNSEERYHKNNVYDRITYFGRYCLFETVESGGAYYPVVVPMAGGGGGMMVGGSSNRVLAQVGINFNNGRVFGLSKKNIREILANDPEMLAEFEDEKKKGQKLEDYLIRYSEKHKEQIK